MMRVSATDIRNNLAHYLNLAAYAGQRIIVEKMGKPLALITGINEQQRKESFDPDKLIRQIEKYAGGGGSAKNLDMRKVFQAMKENYNVKSLFRR